MANERFMLQIYIKSLIFRVFGTVQGLCCVQYGRLLSKNTDKKQKTRSINPLSFVDFIYLCMQTTIVLRLFLYKNRLSMMCKSKF